MDILYHPLRLVNYLSPELVASQVNELLYASYVVVYIPNNLLFIPFAPLHLMGQNCMAMISGLGALLMSSTSWIFWATERCHQMKCKSRHTSVEQSAVGSIVEVTWKLCGACNRDVNWSPFFFCISDDLLNMSVDSPRILITSTSTRVH